MLKFPLTPKVLLGSHLSVYIQITDAVDDQSRMDDARQFAVASWSLSDLFSASSFARFQDLCVSIVSPVATSRMRGLVLQWCFCCSFKGSWCCGWRCGFWKYKRNCCCEWGWRDKTLLGVLYKLCHQRLISRATYISLRGSFLAHVKLSDTCPCENVTLRCAEEDYL